MSWTCDEVLAVLGDKAQLVASGISVLQEDPESSQKTHVLIGRFEGMSFILTQAGTDMLENLVAAEPVVKKPRGVPKPKKADPVVADSEDLSDDLDLDD